MHSTIAARCTVSKNIKNRIHLWVSVTQCHYSLFVFPNNCYYTELVAVIVTDLSVWYFYFKIIPQDAYKFIKLKHKRNVQFEIKNASIGIMNVYLYKLNYVDILFVFIDLEWFYV